VAGALGVGDRLDHAGAVRLVLEENRAVDVERDEEALARRLGGIRRDLLDDLGRLVRRETHAIGSATSRPPR